MWTITLPQGGSFVSTSLGCAREVVIAWVALEELLDQMSVVTNAVVAWNTVCVHAVLKQEAWNGRGAVSMNVTLPGFGWLGSGV